MLSFNIWLSVKWQLQVPVTTAGNQPNFFRNSNKRDLNLWFSVYKGNQLYLLPEGRQISISTLTWDSRPISFYLQANKELDVIVNPVENREINDGYCDPDISEKDYYDCYRNEIKRAIHSQEMAMKLCDGEENFGNCTVPQVWIIIFFMMCF